MGEAETILLDQVEQLFVSLFTEAQTATGSDDAWASIEEMGLSLALVSEDDGGFGLDEGAAWDIVGKCGVHCASLPVAETIIANAVMARAGMVLAESRATLSASSGLTVGADGQVAGRLKRVAWGGEDVTVLAAAASESGSVLVCLPPGSTKLASDGRNLRGHPRPDIEVKAARGDFQIVAMAHAHQRLLQAGAAMRTAQIAGAAAIVTEMTVNYAGERKQFGRGLNKFQAIQQALAELAGQTAAADGAASLAAEGWGDPDRFALVAAAKARAGEACGIICGIAHQIHGAIGFTEEYRLADFTRALWSWRDEFGGQAAMWQAVGDTVLQRPAADLWAFVTGLTETPA